MFTLALYQANIRLNILSILQMKNFLHIKINQFSQKGKQFFKYVIAYMAAKSNNVAWKTIIKKKMLQRWPKVLYNVSMNSSQSPTSTI